MEKDIDRLTEITDRFSKIGSQPELSDLNLDQTISRTADYLGTRLGKKISLTTNLGTESNVQHNGQLISWVLENMIKNAADALEGEGEIPAKAFPPTTSARFSTQDSPPKVAVGDWA